MLTLTVQYICNAYRKYFCTYNGIEVMFMKKFQIPSVPSTTNKCIRFPNDIIEEVEAAIAGKNCTFTAFVIAAVRAALDNLEEE